MLFIYGSLLFMMMSISNVYIGWWMMEMMFLFFLIFTINLESKSVGLIIYFFFQSVVSLFLFVSIFMLFDKLVFLLLVAKLGLFPFFYWVIVVSLKIGFIGNMFVLSLQKFSVFWLMWLTFNTSLVLVYFIVYLSVMFVILALIFTSDLWLMLVYSSVSNSSMLMLSIYGANYFYVVFLYLITVLSIIYLLQLADSHYEIMFVVFMFLVVPPFLLFFMKFYVLLSLEFFLKLSFFLAFLDVFVLIYYFSLIFMKFILVDASMMLYFMNLMILFFVLISSNCVAMIIFYKS